MSEQNLKGNKKMINKKLIMAALILQVGMPVNAEPAINPTQDTKVQAPVKVVLAIHEKYKPIEEEYLRIELANSHKNLSENEKRELFAPVRSKLLPLVKEVRTCIIEDKPYIFRKVA